MLRSTWRCATSKAGVQLDLDLAPITLLFGTNSSGKTAILHALLLLKQTVNSRDPNTHLNFGGGPRDYVDLGSYQGPWCTGMMTKRILLADCHWIGKSWRRNGRLICAIANSWNGMANSGFRTD